MIILGVIVLVLVVYNIYFFYNLMYVLPRRNFLYMKLPFCSKVWEVRVVTQPIVVMDEPTKEPNWECEDEEPEGSLADDELDFVLTKRIDHEDYQIGYQDGIKDGRQEGYTEGFKNGCDNSECGPLVTELVHDLIDRKEFGMAAWLTKELEEMD